MRSGKVSATLTIVSLDLETETIVISRNSHCPTVVWRAGEITLLDEASESVGIGAWTKPVITELPIAPNTYVVAFTDGVLHAGFRRGLPIDVPAVVHELASGGTSAAQGRARAIADAILWRAMDHDDGRPADDISVLVIGVLPAQADADDVRRMSVRFPIRVRGAL
jgi:serine phosphatase RsbU (regulator of sigma subunit)